MIRSLTLAALLALSSAFPGGAQAQSLSQADVLSAHLLPGWRGEGGTHMAALHLVLAPDWKTYWRSPGDAGIPPLFDWTGSENLAAVRLHWPRPTTFELNGMQTIGYKRELVLPLELTPADPLRPILLRATVDLGVCRDVCMPAFLELRADLPPGGAPDPLIVAALRARPHSGDQAGLAAIDCTVEPIADGLRLTARMDLPPTGGQETVVFEAGRAEVWVSESVVAREGGQLVAMADLVPPGGAPFALDRGRVTVTVLGQDRAVEISGCPAP